MRQEAAQFRRPAVWRCNNEEYHRRYPGSYKAHTPIALKRYGVQARATDHEAWQRRVNEHHQVLRETPCFFAKDGIVAQLLAVVPSRPDQNRMFFGSLLIVSYVGSGYSFQYRLPCFISQENPYGSGDTISWHKQLCEAN